MLFVPKAGDALRQNGSAVHRRNTGLGRWDGGHLFRPDPHAMAHLGAGGRRQIFRGRSRFHDGVALPLMAKEFGLGATEKGVIAAASLLGISDRRHGLRRPGRSLWPQADVHHRDGAVRHLRAGRDVQSVLPRRCHCPSRHRRRARLRLSDRPPDHFRKHSKPHPRADGAQRIWLSGGGGLGGHGYRFVDTL